MIPASITSFNKRILQDYGKASIVIRNCERLVVIYFCIWKAVVCEKLLTKWICSDSNLGHITTTIVSDELF